MVMFRHYNLSIVICYILQYLVDNKKYDYDRFVQRK